MNAKSHLTDSDFKKFEKIDSGLIQNAQYVLRLDAYNYNQYISKLDFNNKITVNTEIFKACKSLLGFTTNLNCYFILCCDYKIFMVFKANELPVLSSKTISFNSSVLSSVFNRNYIHKENPNYLLLWNAKVFLMDDTVLWKYLENKQSHFKIKTGKLGEVIYKRKDRTCSLMAPYFKKDIDFFQFLENTDSETNPIIYSDIYQ